MNWVSTKDRLPKTDNGKSVLFVFDNDVKFGTYEQHRSGVFFFDIFSIRYAPDRVSYWMEIPKFPGETDGIL